MFIDPSTSDVCSPSRGARPNLGFDTLILNGMVGYLSRPRVRVIDPSEQLPVGELPVFQHLADVQKWRGRLRPRARRALEHLRACLVAHPIDQY